MAYIARANERGFERFEGTSRMELDFGNGTGQLDSNARTGNGEAVAVIDAPLDFDVATGKFTSDGGTLRYTDADGTLNPAWGVAGGVNGANAGFSATHGSEQGATALIGRGVMAGERD